MLFGQHFDSELPRNLNHVFLKQFQNCCNKKLARLCSKMKRRSHLKAVHLHCSDMPLRKSKIGRMVGWESQNRLFLANTRHIGCHFSAATTHSLAKRLHSRVDESWASISSWNLANQRGVQKSRKCENFTSKIKKFGAVTGWWLHFRPSLPPPPPLPSLSPSLPTIDWKWKIQSRFKMKNAVPVYRSCLIVPVNNSGLMLRVSNDNKTGPERSAPGIKITNLTFPARQESPPHERCSTPSCDPGESSWQREADQFVSLLKVSRLVTADRQTKLTTKKTQDNGMIQGKWGFYHAQGPQGQLQQRSSLSVN